MSSVAIRSHVIASSSGRAPGASTAPTGAIQKAALSATIVFDTVDMACLPKVSNEENLIHESALHIPHWRGWVFVRWKLLLHHAILLRQSSFS